MKKVIKSIGFIAIFLILLSIFDKLYNPAGTLKEWYQSNATLDYYKQRKNTIDVLYVGDSSIYAGVSPMEIYNAIGVTGYSCSSPGQRTWSSYYIIKEAMKTQKPKIVFLEVGEFFSKKDNQDELSTRTAIDPLKFSTNKIEMINDDVYNLSPYEKLGCIFPTIRYHSRWSKINEIDIRKFVNKSELTYKGYLLEKNIKKYENKNNNTNSKQNKTRKNSNYKSEKKAKIEENNQEIEETNQTIIPKEVTDKIEAIIELCKKNNSELVLLSMPTPKTWTETKSNTISNYAKDNNLKYIDLNTDSKISMEWEKDSQDAGDHLNIYGAEKVAKYLSDFIKENYNLEDHRNNPKYELWNQELVAYTNVKEEKKNQ